jgi:signal transduction histidine kinase
MNIRARLTLAFFIIVTVVLTLISSAIYFFSENYREQDFYRRLKNRAINTAKVLMEIKEVNAALLKRMERNNPASLSNQYIFIYNEHDEELYSSDETPSTLVDSILLSSIKRQQEIRYRNDKYEVLGFVYKDMDNEFTIVAGATDVYGLDAIRNLRNVLLITLGVSMFMVSFLGWIFAGRALNPISRIVKQVENITEENLNKRLDEGNTRDELSKLSQTFNHMLGRLQSAFASQKNFIANASHEIKTPLTVMSGEIEVSLLQNRQKEYYVKVLRSVLQGLKGLNKLSTQLLLLAQTSTDHPEKNFTSLRIDDILWEMKEELAKAFSEYNVQIDFDIELKPESLVVDGDEQLLKVAMFNLMDNGCKYSNDNAVTVTLNSNGTEVQINFLNKGKEIAPDQLERIFEPFYRGNNDKKIRGFGIGLSLTKRIITLHAGAINVFSSSQATTFSVLLPIKRL